MSLLSLYKSGGNGPYVEVAWMTSLADPLQYSATNSITLANLNTKLVDSANIATLANNRVTIPRGRYAYEVNVNIGSYYSYNLHMVGLTANEAQPLVGFRAGTAVTAYISQHYWGGQFQLSNTNSVGIVVASAVGEAGWIGMHSYYGPGMGLDSVYRYSTTYFVPNGSDPNNNQRTTLKLWRLG